MLDKSIPEWKKNAEKRRVKQLVIKTLVDILELYPDTSTAIHLVTILRSKGLKTGENQDGTPKYRDPYFIKEESLLKVLENYKEELDLIALESLNPEEDD